MVEVSNEALALLMVAVLVVTIGAVISISWLEGGVTGHATTDTKYGTASVNISESVTIVVAQNVDFGTGYTNGSNCTLTTLDGTNVPACWTNATAYNPQNFTINNQGNVPFNLTLTSTYNATGFFGVTSPQTYYEFKTVNGTGTGCSGSAAITWTAFDKTTQLVCGNMNISAGDENLDIAVNITVPSTASGYRNDTITFESTAI